MFKIYRAASSELACISGPDSAEPSAYNELICAHSISTYPHLPINEKR